MSTTVIWVVVAACAFGAVAGYVASGAVLGPGVLAVLIGVLAGLGLAAFVHRTIQRHHTQP